MALRKLTDADLDFCKLIDADEFIGMCVEQSLIDYDGFAYPVYGDEVDLKVQIAPSDVVDDSLPDDVTHVLWYNR